LGVRARPGFCFAHYGGRATPPPRTDQENWEIGKKEENKRKWEMAVTP
jgi:hypothetical protein